MKALGAAGRRTEAMAVLGELDRTARSRYVSPMFRAMVCAGYGDRD